MTLDFLRQVYYVAWGDMRFMRHNFANILIMSIMSPILYLIAFGFGLRTGETSIGVSYVAFVIPGIAALSSLSSSFSSTSTRMNVQRLYYKSFDEMMMCPLSLSAIVLGKCMLGIVRGLIASGRRVRRAHRRAQRGDDREMTSRQPISARTPSARLSALRSSSLK